MATRRYASQRSTSTRRTRRTKYSGDGLPFDDPVFLVIAGLAILLFVIPTEYRILLGIVIALCIWIYVTAELKKQRLAKRRLQLAGIDHIDTMDGKVFEDRLALLFRQQGYVVEQTPYSGDYGADLVVVKAGVRSVVQAKRYSKAVGLTAVQEAVAAKAKYRCTEAFVVCNQGFTRAAKELAQVNGVTLWDREELIEQIIREPQL